MVEKKQQVLGEDHQLGNTCGLSFPFAFEPFFFLFVVVKVRKGIARTFHLQIFWQICSSLSCKQQYIASLYLKNSR